MQVRGEMNPEIAELLKRAQAGEAKAQYELGVYYERGKGVVKDYAKVVTWYRRAAEQGYARAQCNLGMCYERGEGVIKDYVEAVTWYRRAAEQGLARAQCNLGYCYDKGIGVPQNDAEAVTWYRRAAEQGYAHAQYNLGVYYERGKGVVKDYAKAVTWYRRAAGHGTAEAQNNLGVCYFLGTGVPQDDVLAVAWFRRAAEQGHVKAKNNLDELIGTLKQANQHRLAARAQYNSLMVEGDLNQIVEQLISGSNHAQKGILDGILCDYERCHNQPQLRQQLDKLFAALPKEHMPIELLQQIYTARALLFKPELGNQDSLNTFFTDLSEIDVAYLPTDKIIPLSAAIIDAWALASQSEDIEEVQECAKGLFDDLTRLLYLAKGKDIMMPDSLFSGMGDILVKSHLGTSYSIAINSLDENKLLLLATMFECAKGKSAPEMMKHVNHVLGGEVVVNPEMQKESLLQAAGLFADKGKEGDGVDVAECVKRLQLS